MKFIKYFFVTLGVIFFVILIALGYVWVTDWSGVRSFVTTVTELSDINITPARTETSTEETENEITESTESTDSIPTTNNTDTPTLEELRTGEATLTAAQIECLREKLGSDRVDEIYESGQQPSAREIMIGMTCL